MPIQPAGGMGIAACVMAETLEAGSAVVEQIESWASPFRDGWENWRPDPQWPVPLLPRDWDGTPPPARAGSARPARNGLNGHRRS